MKKYIKETIWALSIIAFVACLVMAWAKGSVPYTIAAAICMTIWLWMSVNDYNDNENYFIEKKERMKL